MNTQELIDKVEDMFYKLGDKRQNPHPRWVYFYDGEAQAYGQTLTYLQQSPDVSLEHLTSELQMCIRENLNESDQIYKGFNCGCYKILKAISPNIFVLTKIQNTPNSVANK